MAGDARLRVATYNLYLGADLSLVFEARDHHELARRSAVVASQLATTDFARRAEAVAALLARERPDLVGVQEAVRWSRGSASGSREVWSDFLPLLLDALERAGEAYDAHAVSANFEGGGALSAEESLHVAGANAVLCRRTSDIEVVGEATGDFETVLHLTAALEQVSFDVARSWGWVDVRVSGEPLRFVNTHTEAYDAQVRAAQRDELLAAVADPGVPVVVVGDFNAGPADVGMPAPYADAWLAAGNEPQGGLTCGQGADLSNPTSQLRERIDYVFVRGARVDGCWVVGDRSEDRTACSSLWPSDHACVVADVVVAPTKLP